MRVKMLRLVSTIAVLLMVAVPVLAHHGSSAYDLTKTTTLKATVTGWVWSNPHCLLEFDAKDDTGTVRHWALETYNPLWMSRAGWTRDTLKPGDEIEISFHAAKNGTPNGYIREGDGKIIFQGKELNLSQGGTP